MKGDAIPGANHVLRYVRPTCIDTVDGRPEVQGTAFWTRPIDDHGASCNWLEYFSGSEEEQVAEIRKRARLKLAATGLLAKLNVGDIRAALQDGFPEQMIDVLEDPLEATDTYASDPSHALIINVPADGEPLAEAIGDVLAGIVVGAFPTR